jgi:hypothetical protein
VVKWDDFEPSGFDYDLDNDELASMTQLNETEKEIDDRVIAQADDPTAWEEEVVVHPRRWRVSPSRLDQAAKFFVLSALHRLGADAALAIGEPDDVDIVIINERSVITAQIKTLTGGWRWHVQTIRARENHFVIFVGFTTDIHNPHVSPEVFVVRSQALKAALLRQQDNEINVDRLGAELNAHEAWHELVAPSPAA